MAQLRILLANDTSLLGHFGSALVVRRLVELAGDQDAYLQTGWGWERVEAEEFAADRWDAVIVNGEGSIHHDSATARRVARLAVRLAEAGLPAYLVNASEEANGAEVRAGLAAFRRCYVRDRASADSLADAGIAAEVVPDLTLSWADAPRWTGGGRRLYVTDASETKTSRRLFDLSQGHGGARFVSLRTTPPHAADGRANRRRRGLFWKRLLARVLPPSPWAARYADPFGSVEAFARTLAEDASGLVAGRYHGLCLALRMRIPVLAVAGNTSKSGALLADAGLPAREMTLDRLEAEGLPAPVPIYTADEERHLDALLAHAERGAHDMMQTIAADIRDIRGAGART
ncbi:polysaccharide pyruvyl transferase family protein [Futiania mangrovi]|uniref:Polysaccharide pyruvyl transferase family protein n=1 Tax=Futiania mangrovi TaxID=2959716 RepID=A0A9J6PFH0_9PROT|nr:polysaccharide pyruvyl transferase family protein [Futiania mangrovii]MCP1336576.1 polysaccharide pyruvyl transferase family protein [Futiania mangrovii]